MEVEVRRPQILVPPSMTGVLERLFYTAQFGTESERLVAIQNFEQENKKLPEAFIPSYHHFINGMYWRERPVTRGMVITTITHAEDNITVIPFGRFVIFSPKEGAVTVVGPTMFESKAGVKRVIFVLEDGVFSTIHPNPEDERDTEKLEARLTALEVEV